MTTFTQKTQAQANEHREEQLDQGLEESFPASDPVSIEIDKIKLPAAPQQAANKSKAQGE